jgi:hypothetical protein
MKWTGGIGRGIEKVSGREGESGIYVRRGKDLGA